MDYDYIAGEIEGIFNPEPDEDGHRREWPQERLRKHHGLDFTFMEDWLWEGATSHPNTRTWPDSEPGVDELTRSMDVPGRLFLSALHVFADSILTYSTGKEKDKPSELRFYPPVILTFWRGLKHSCGIPRS